MRLFEIVNQTYYIAVQTKKKPGSIERVTENIVVLGSDLEALLEEYRPGGCVPRSKSIHMATRLCGTARFEYAVQPMGKVDENHGGWLKLMAEASFQRGVLSHYAEAYWSGRPCEKEPDAPWEYRTEAVKILHRAGGDVNEP